MGHYVYKYVYNNEIIYIGKNDTNLVDRLNQHGKTGDNITQDGWDEINNSDIYYAELANSTMADVVETELICKYKPKYNIAKKSDWIGLTFIEPVWYLYKKNDPKEIKELKFKLAVLDNENRELKEKIEKISKDKESYYKKIKDELMDDFRSFEFYSFSFKYFEEESYYSYDEVLNLYKTTNFPIAFISEAFDANHNIICKKIIYTTVYDSLEFHFWQINTTEVSGMIFRSREQETQSNWITLKNWINRGSNLWSPYINKDGKYSVYNNNTTN